MKDILHLFFLLSPAFVFGDYLDNNCGSHVDVPSYGSSYTIGSGRNLINDCVVHFDRSTYGKISLTITGNSLNSFDCQVNVKDGSNIFSKTNGNIDSAVSFTRTVSSDTLGSLYVHVKGQSCNLYGLAFTLSQTCADFTCDNGHCVYRFDVCDQRDDCGDNSDEHNCWTLTAGHISGIAVGSIVGLAILITIVSVVCRRYRTTTVVYGQFGSGPAVISTSNMAVTQSRW